MWSLGVGFVCCCKCRLRFVRSRTSGVKLENKRERERGKTPGGLLFPKTVRSSGF
jgi:hypothetical protein